MGAEGGASGKKIAKAENCFKMGKVWESNV